MMETASPQRRRPGLGWIIAYKLTLAPVTLGLAVWLTLSPSNAFASLARLAHQLAEAGPLWARLAHWANARLSVHFLSEAAIFAWLGGLSTAVEGLLLLRGGVWAEWIVAIGLALLVPLELFALIRHPAPAKAILLAGNVIIVTYLVHGRLSPQKAIQTVK
jgi:hypothetical protein